MGSGSPESAREALRRKHNVELVSASQEGFAAETLPDGVYGFTSSPALASPLFSVRHYRNFEVHRLANAVSAVIGFVTPSEARQLADPQSQPVSILLHPDAEGDATAIVSLPYDRVTQHRQYSVRNAAAIALQIAPAGGVGV
jgi:hypothetical protein